jgi:type I restriction enzyme S subunit
MLEKINFNDLDKSKWESFRFDEIANRVSEGVDPNTTTLEKYVGLEHIDAENIHIKRSGSPDDVSGGKLKCYPGDVIFGKRRAYQRKAAIVDFEGICSAHAFVFRANQDVIESRLFPFFLHSDQFMHRAIDISVGGLSPTINWGDIRHQIFLIPPKSEQVHLAELLWAMDNLIMKKREVLDKLILSKKSLVNNFFNSGFEKFELKKIVECLDEFQNGYAFSSKGYLENGIPIITMANINLTGRFEQKEYNYWDYNSTLERYIVHEGDLIIAMTDVTPSKNLIGKMAIVDMAGPFFLNQRVGLLKINKRMILSKYVQLFSISDKFRWYSISHSTLGVQSNLGTEDIKKAKIPLPTIREQQNFINECSLIEKSIYSMENFLISLQSLQKSIINQIF